MPRGPPADPLRRTDALPISGTAPDRARAADHAAMAEHLALAATEPPPLAPATAEVLFARQPHPGRREPPGRLRAALPRRGRPECPHAATSRVAASALSDLGLRQATGGAPAFINVTTEFLLAMDPLPFGPEGVVLEIAADRVPDEPLIERLGRLRQHGYMLALDGYAGQPGAEPLLDLAQLAKVDARGGGAPAGRPGRQAARPRPAPGRQRRRRLHRSRPLRRRRLRALPGRLRLPAARDRRPQRSDGVDRRAAPGRRHLGRRRGRRRAREGHRPRPGPEPASAAVRQQRGVLAAPPDQVRPPGDRPARPPHRAPVGDAPAASAASTSSAARCWSRPCRADGPARRSPAAWAPTTPTPTSSPACCRSSTRCWTCRWTRPSRPAARRGRRRRARAARRRQGPHADDGRGLRARRLGRSGAARASTPPSSPSCTSRPSTWADATASGPDVSAGLAAAAAPLRPRACSSRVRRSSTVAAASPATSCSTAARATRTARSPTPSTPTCQVLVGAFAEVGLQRRGRRRRPRSSTSPSASCARSTRCRWSPSAPCSSCSRTRRRSPALMARLRGLRGQGFRIALDDFAPDGRQRAVPRRRRPRQGRPARARPPPRRAADAPLAARGLTVVAEKVEDQDEADWRAAAGAELFQGYFFCQPVELAGTELRAASTWRACAPPPG